MVKRATTWNNEVETKDLCTVQHEIRVFYFVALMSVGLAARPSCVDRL
jgi:hypothetical protein